MRGAGDPTPERHAVFVYGTLRPHQVNWPIVEPYCEHHEPGVLRHHALFELDYPCAVGIGSGPPSLDAVHGDLLWLRPDLAVAALADLDRFEGHDRVDPRRSLYVRERRRVERRAGEMVEAWVYVAGPSLEAQLTDDRRIASGTWPPA